jgi:hypothetical protein
MPDQIYPENALGAVIWLVALWPPGNFVKKPMKDDGAVTLFLV